MPPWAHSRGDVRTGTPSPRPRSPPAARSSKEARRGVLSKPCYSCGWLRFLGTTAQSADANNCRAQRRRSVVPDRSERPVPAVGAGRVSCADLRLNGIDPLPSRPRGRRCATSGGLGLARPTFPSLTTHGPPETRVTHHLCPSLASEESARARGTRERPVHPL
jgi:hypothetical protein